MKVNGTTIFKVFLDFIHLLTLRIKKDLIIGKIFKRENKQNSKHSYSSLATNVLF